VTLNVTVISNEVSAIIKTSYDQPKGRLFPKMHNTAQLFRVIHANRINNFKIVFLDILRVIFFKINYNYYIRIGDFIVEYLNQIKRVIYYFIPFINTNPTRVIII